jgi:iron(III) transport system ATP-binding protein
LARALAPSPHLLLLDEPLSALDAQVRQGLRQQIRQLHVRLGLTTIMVTHDQEEALTMADRIVVMDHGRIEQVGSPQEIYARPASLFVARFVGAMNFLPGQAEGGGTIRLDDLVLRCADDSPPGSAVTLCLRPEDVVLRDPAGPNLLTGRIEALELLGPFHRATLRIDRLKEPLLADISANLMRDLQLAPGRPVTLALPPDRLQKFAIDRR